MKWLNLNYDNAGHVTYQMNRLSRYKEVVDQLMEKGLAYKCYATKEELEQMREDQKARGEKSSLWRSLASWKLCRQANSWGVTPSSALEIRMTAPSHGMTACTVNRYQ